MEPSLPNQTEELQQIDLSSFDNSVAAQLIDSIATDLPSNVCLAEIHAVSDPEDVLSLAAPLPADLSALPCDQGHHPERLTDQAVLLAEEALQEPHLQL